MDSRGVDIGPYSVVWATFRVFFTLAVVITIVVFARAYVRVEQDTFPLDAALLVDRAITDSPLVYRDVHTRRLLPGVLDASRTDSPLCAGDCVAVSADLLDRSVCYGDCAVAPLAAKFSVGDRTFFFHKRQFDVLAGIPSEFGGPGGVRVSVIRRLVLLRGGDGVLSPAVLTAEVRSSRG